MVSLAMKRRVIFFVCSRKLTVNVSVAERIFVGRSHVARVAEARLEQINRYCQVSGLSVLHYLTFWGKQWVDVISTHTLVPHTPCDMHTRKPYRLLVQVVACQMQPG